MWANSWVVVVIFIFYVHKFIVSKIKSLNIWAIELNLTISLFISIEEAAVFFLLKIIKKKGGAMGFFFKELF